MSEIDEEPTTTGPTHFRTTAWSVILGAQEGEGEDRRACLARLCKTYWKPIYYYMRRRGLNHEDALDLTQEYFAQFLEKDYVSTADPERGRFRTFVLVTVNRFLTKQLARRNRRPERLGIVLPTEEDGEDFYLPDLADGETAEDDFNRRWALSLIEATLEKMKEVCSEGRKKDYYETFRMYLESAGEPRKLSYRELAKRFGVSESDITNFLYRGRNIFQKLLRDTIRQSVERESAIDEEIEALKAYLRR